jgi:sterol desaturase/sphingolipid hydroxylase (fatty acid hydroxylase superfamily)
MFATSRTAQGPVYFRWLNHFVLLFLDNIISKLVLPVVTVGLAFAVAEKGWGLFNAVDLPVSLVFVLTMLLLDLNNYIQHRLMHKIPIFWRVHKVHHTDIDVDWSTAFRFHPGEFILTLGLQAVVITLLGAPPAAVAIYEIVFVISAFFVHANVVLPAELEHRLRLLLVTPDMHRVHHSSRRLECDANYSGIFSWWDRWFSTYKKEPLLGQLDMVLGLPQYREAHEQTLLWLLKLPFEGNGKLVPSRQFSENEKVIP